jgi:hypothetical protein
MNDLIRIETAIVDIVRPGLKMVRPLRKNEVLASLEDTEKAMAFDLAVMHPAVTETLIRDGEGYSFGIYWAGFNNYFMVGYKDSAYTEICSTIRTKLEEEEK